MENKLKEFDKNKIKVLTDLGYDTSRREYTEAELDEMEEKLMDYIEKYDLLYDEDPTMYNSATALYTDSEYYFIEIQ